MQVKTSQGPFQDTGGDGSPRHRGGAIMEGDAPMVEEAHKTRSLEISFLTDPFSIPEWRPNCLHLEAVGCHLSLQLAWLNINDTWVQRIISRAYTIHFSLLLPRNIPNVPPNQRETPELEI